MSAAKGGPGPTSWRSTLRCLCLRSRLIPSLPGERPLWELQGRDRCVVFFNVFSGRSDFQNEHFSFNSWAFQLKLHPVGGAKKTTELAVSNWRLCNLIGLFRLNCGQAVQYNFSLTVVAPPPVVRIVAPSSVSQECSFSSLAQDYPREVLLVVSKTMKSEVLKGSLWGVSRTFAHEAAGLDASGSFDPSFPSGAFAELVAWRDSKFSWCVFSFFRRIALWWEHITWIY